MKRNSILPMNVNPGYLPREFVQCLSRSHKALPHLMEIKEASSAIPNMARTWNGTFFLESEAEWALLIDSDMTWEPSSIIRLMKTAKEKKAKIVSGLTFMSFESRIAPHAYELIPDGQGYKKLAAYAVLPSYTEPFTVRAVGGACLLVHRDVYADILEMTKGTTKHYWQQDVYVPEADDMIGEDLTFCKRAREAGYEIWYEPRAFFPHLERGRLITIQKHFEFLDSMGIQHPGLALQ